MRYFFHLRSSNDIIPDYDGINIEDCNSVRSAVLKALAEIGGQIPEVVQHLSDWRFVVCTSSEEVVSLPLREISLAAAERSLMQWIGSEELRERAADTVRLGAMSAA